MTRGWISSFPVVVIFFTVTSCQDYSISHISPKSQLYNADHENIQPSMAVNFEAPIEELYHEERVKRSASPILNEGKTSGKINHFDSNDVESSGRYYSSSIKPTLTQNDDGKKRTDKGLMDDNSFLGERGRRAKSSRPLDLTPSSVMQTELSATKQPNSPRQGGNPDIQDIITGIVKLLNGNVNVHANNGGTRRPNNNRINNRGPPRISEAQVPGNDIQEPTKVQNSQSPYPFDRPEGPLRPFLNGIPIPEQIVPSMNQNNRPGFVSTNRLPWHRPRPRPPVINNRRPPIPSYRPPSPIPAGIPEFKRPEEEQYVNQNLSESSDEKPVNENEPDGFSYEDLENETSENPPSKKKKIEKKPESISPSITTILQSTSEVNTIQKLDGSSESSEITILSDHSHLEPSINDASIQSLSSSTTTETPSLSRTPALDRSSLITSSQIVLPSIQTSPNNNNQQQQTQFHPRPGLVLDDPEFQPGQQNLNSRPRQPIIQQKPNLPPGYGEIFDITLSAIQGPNGNTGSQQTLNIKPYGTYEGSDIILSPSGDQAFVSIDGKRSYINLFGDSTESPFISSSQTATKIQINPTGVLAPGVTGSGYVVAETEPTIKKPIHQQNRPIQRPRQPSQQPPVRIDTCIVNDDSTCDKNQNEKCKTENGVSSCNCRPSYARRKHREPCRRIVSVVVSLRVDKIYDRRVAWDRNLAEYTSEPHQQLSYEAIRAIDSAMSMTPFSDEFIEAKVNNIYQGDPAQGLAGVFVNLTLMIEENGETIRPALKGDIQRHLLGVIHRRNNNIGNSALFVESPPGSVSAIQDLDECSSHDLHDCHPEAVCSNIWGGFRCECSSGYKDPFADQPNRAGRECNTCSDSFCSNRGSCSFDMAGHQVCNCMGSFYGATCDVDGEVLAVAVGASVAAIIIIILTLICLIMWSRRWQREHKNAMVGSPVFGYLGGGQVKTPAMGTAPYQVTLEDRMRWAQIADVMAQSNHYGIEPVAATRPSSAIFHAYPQLQTISGMNTLGAMSMGGMTMHTNATLPPVPLPRLGLGRLNGMRALENSSSSEEEDRTDLLGRNFQVPRPKSRSNASVTSGIYYDVDYLPSGEHHLYGTANNPGSQIPMSQMSTYTPGRTPSTTYYK